MHRNTRFLAQVLALTASAWVLDFAAASPRGGCTSIANVNQLQAMQNNVGGSYCLANDIDAGSVANFTPIGSNVNQFTGRFDGRGFAIRNLTIKQSGGSSPVGLFAATNNAVIEDVSLIGVKVVHLDGGTVGALVGTLDANNGASTVARVHVSGQVKCKVGTNCTAGGIIGFANGSGILRDSSSSAEVIGNVQAGGAVGGFHESTIARTYATGAVSCTASPCMAGGLIGRASLNGAVMTSFATGPVAAAGGNDSRAGGLIAYTESGVTISRSYAAGPVSGGATGIVAALIGQHNSGGDIDQTYAVGAVSSTGATTGGLIANAGGSPSITSSYWDTETTGQATSAAGTTGLTTNQLRADLPAGFGASWGITKTRSYPFLINSHIDFASPLATLVRFSLAYVFLPISQRDDSQYIDPPAHSNKASLAAVYTMIARAIGISANVPELQNVKIDEYFWDDATQTTTWQGPITDHATLGNRKPIASGTPLDNSNVIGRMDMQRLVILRGTYTRNGGGTATHWMLGTLYSTNPDDSVKAALADDPLTGLQVTIDPITKKVIAPANFPLANFKVDRYQPVTLTPPVVSDIRLKRDISEVARLDNGLGLYRYRYLWSDQVYVGVMAQEVASIVPAAAVPGPDGYLRVNYGRLGMRLQTWDEWLVRGRFEVRAE